MLSYITNVDDEVTMVNILNVLSQVNISDLMSSSRRAVTTAKRSLFSSSRTSSDTVDWCILEME